MELDTAQLEKFAVEFPKDFFQTPSGSLPADCHLVYSLKEAVDMWEPSDHSISMDDESILDFNSPNKLSCGPMAIQGKLHHGYDCLDIINAPKSDLFKVHKIKSSNQRRTVNKYFEFVDDLFPGDLILLSESTSIFSALGSFFLSPDKEKYPYFKAIIEIILAGGLPVAWKGEISGPVAPYTYSPTYEFVFGSFVVFWPYEDSPTFSDRVCEL